MTARWVSWLVLLLGAGACGRDHDGDRVTVRQGDCDDANAHIFPGAAEICNQQDDDCDQHIDEDAIDARFFFADADGDGHAGPNVSLSACVPPTTEGWSDVPTDCDDLDPLAFPGGAEICDGADNDCDGLLDDADDSVDIRTFQEFFRDIDGDGFGADDQTTRACSPPKGYTAQAHDCDDGDPELYPYRPWHADRDADGFGSTAEIFPSCLPPEGFLADDTDCDDLDPLIHPSSVEICDSVDNDCDGLLDDADDSVDNDTFRDFFLDIDGDGFGADDQPTQACSPPGGAVVLAGDCDDLRADIHPDAEEVCNDSLDNNCDSDAWPCGFQGDNYPADAGLRISGSSGNLSYDIAVADLDGDGQHDLIVPAYATGGGEVYLRYGPLTADLSLPGDADLQLSGATTFDYAGKSVSAGDADGDGYAELVVGAYGVDAYGNLAGAAFLIYGGAPLSGLLGLGSAADRSWYGTHSNDALGTVVRFVGDLDGDGYDDLALGGTGYDSGDGAVFVIYGGTAESGSALDSDADARLLAESSGDLLGEARSITGGDLDGDGLAELVVRAALSDLGGQDAGAVVLFYGGTRLSGEVDLSDADASFVSSVADAELGAGLTIGGDLDADGYADLVIGATGVDPNVRNEGAAYILPGGRTRYAASAVVATTAPATLTGDAVSDYAGAGLSPAGDFDADGYDDILMGAVGVDDGGHSAVGAAYLFCGPVTGSRSVRDADATLLGSASYAYAGHALASGDINGDAAGDVLISTHGEDQLLVFFGGDL